MRRHASILALAAALAPAALAAQEVLRVPLSADIVSFDPDNAFEVAGLGAINAVYEGLVEYAPGGTEVVPLLAESWEVSGDGLTYTFRLREGVLFHDGTPFDAEAMRLSLERRRGADVVLGYFLWNVQAVEAPDPLTLRLVLGQPQPSLLDSLASPWGPKAVSPAVLAEQAGDQGKAWLVENAVGTGPFRLAEFSRGRQVVLERFEAYHGAAPFFDAVEIPIVPDVGTQMLQLRTQELDAVPVNYPWEQLAALPPGVTLTAQPSMALLTGFANPTGPMGDPALREAVLAAVNPEGWVDEAFAGHAAPARSLFPAAMLDPATPVAWPSDLDAARAAVEAAGGASLVIGYDTAETPNVERAADLMAASLAGIGVEATVQVLPTGAIFSLWEDPEAAPDLVLARQAPDAAHPETLTGVFYATEAPLNLFKVSVPEADALAAEGSALTDVAARDAAFEEAGRLWWEAGDFVPFADIEDVVVHAEGLVDLGLRTPWPAGNLDYGTVRWE